MRLRHLILCIAFFSLFQAIVAQPINRSLHPQPVNIANKLMPTTIHGAWLIGGSAGEYMGYPAFQPWLALADAGGSLIWERYLNDAEAVELAQVNSLCEDTLSGFFYVAGAVSGCDYLIPGFIYMLAGNGEALWYKPTELFYNPIAAALPMQGVLVAETGAGLIEWRDMSGEITASFDLEDEFNLKLVDMLTTGPGTVVLMGRDQALLTEWADGAMQVTASIFLPGGKSISTTSSGRLVVAAGEKAFLLDDNLNFLSEKDLSTYGNFGEVSCGSGRCYLGGQSSEGVYIALAMDEGLNHLQTIDMGPAYNYPASLAAREDGFLALGHSLPHETTAEPYADLGVFTTTKGSDIFLRSWDMAGNAAISQRDIAVEEVTVGQHDIITGQESCYPIGAGYMQGSLSGIEIQVRNQGTATIDRIELNAVFQPCWFICYSQQNISQTFNSLSLQPGESAVLQLGSIQTWPLPRESNLRLCIWASGPDGQLDNYFGNNRACATLVVSDVEEPGAALKLRLFPNPASEVLNVHFDAPLPNETAMEVLNPMGQSLYREVLSQGQSATQLPVNNLPAGLYYLKIRHEKGGVVRPWIKN